MKKIITLIVLTIAILCTAKAGESQFFAPYKYQGKDTILNQNGSKLFLKKNMIVYLQGKINLKKDSLEFVSIDKVNLISYLKEKNNLTTSFSKKDVNDTLKVINANSLSELVARNASEKELSISKFQSVDSVFAIRNNCNAPIAIYINGVFDSTISPHETRLIGAQTLGNGDNDIWFCGENFIPTHTNLVFQRESKESWNINATVLLIVILIIAFVGGVGFIAYKRRKKGSQIGHSNYEFHVYETTDKTFNDCFSPLSLNQKREFNKKETKQKRRRGRKQTTIDSPIKLKYVVQQIKILENYNKEYIHNLIYNYYNSLQTCKKIYNFVCDKLANRTFEFELPVQIVEIGDTKEECNDDKRFEYIKKVRRYVKRIIIEEAISKEVEEIDIWSQISNDLSNLRNILNIPGKNAKDFETDEEKILVSKDNETTETLIDKEFNTPSNIMNENDYQNNEKNAEKYIVNIEKCIKNLHDSIEKDTIHSTTEIKERNHKIEELQTKLYDLTRKEQELDEINCKIEEELNQVKQEKEQYLSKANQLLKDTEEKSKDIERLKIESKEYNELLVFHKSCIPTAKIALEIVDSARQAQHLACELYQSYKEKGLDMDAFCYFMERISQKFNDSMKHLSSKSELFNTELQLIARTGMTIRNGWIDNLVANKKDDKEKNEAFIMKLYSDYMSLFIGNALTMTDEYAYFIPAMVADVDKNISEKFIILSNNIQKAAKTLGYQICYARVITHISQYSDVENVDYVDAGDKFAKDTIMEIKDMAVNYGSNKSMTKVSVQK